MKRKTLAFICATFFISAPTFAQWGGGSVPTWTMWNIGVGLPAPSFNVKVDVESAEQICTSCPTSLTPTTELRLSRKLTTDMTWPHGYTSPNYIEAWKETFDQAHNVITPNTLGFVLDDQFKVGIGYGTPIRRLDVHNGDIAMTNSSDNAGRHIVGTSNRNYLGIYANYSHTDGPAIEMRAMGYAPSGDAGEIKFTNYGKRSKFVFGKYNPGTSTLERHIVIDDIGDINMVRWHNDPDPRRIIANTHQGGLHLITGTTSADGPAIEMYGFNNADPVKKGSIHFVSHHASDPNGIGFAFANYNGTNWPNAMTIYKNGKVMIGQPANGTPNNYKLYVQDGILTDKLKVALNNSGDWSDYVFADNYELRTLDEVESFIKENKHLPDVPSADEVVKTGIDVAAMDAKLLQKVEELTLYAIEQQKQLNELQKQLITAQQQLSKFSNK